MDTKQREIYRLRESDLHVFFILCYLLIFKVEFKKNKRVRY